MDGGKVCCQIRELLSHAGRDEGQPAGDPDHAPHAAGALVRSNRGRRAARKVWACACCGIKPEALMNGKLRECKGCGSVRYCGKECQMAHWPAHKAPCKASQAAKVDAVITVPSF
jgi:hypothetical protein